MKRTFIGAAAASRGADELVTAQAPEKPIHRSRTVRIVPDPSVQEWQPAEANAEGGGCEDVSTAG